MTLDGFLRERRTGSAGQDRRPEPGGSRGRGSARCSPGGCRRHVAGSRGIRRTASSPRGVSHSSQAASAARKAALPMPGGPGRQQGVVQASGGPRAADGLPLGRLPGQGGAHRRRSTARSMAARTCVRAGRGVDDAVALRMLARARPGRHRARAGERRPFPARNGPRRCAGWRARVRSRPAGPAAASDPAARAPAAGLRAPPPAPRQVRARRPGRRSWRPRSGRTAPTARPSSAGRISARHVFAAGGEHQQQFGQGRHRTLVRRQQQLAQAFAQRRAARLAGCAARSCRAAPGRPSGPPAAGLAGAFEAFQRDEAGAAHDAHRSRLAGVGSSPRPGCARRSVRENTWLPSPRATKYR